MIVDAIALVLQEVPQNQKRINLGVSFKFFSISETLFSMLKHLRALFTVVVNIMANIYQICTVFQILY